MSFLNAPEFDFPFLMSVWTSEEMWSQYHCNARFKEALEKSWAELPCVCDRCLMGNDEGRAILGILSRIDRHALTHPLMRHAPLLGGNEDPSLFDATDISLFRDPATSCEVSQEDTRSSMSPVMEKIFTEFCESLIPKRRH